MRGGGEWLKPWTWGTPSTAVETTGAATTAAATELKPLGDAVTDSVGLGAQPGGTTTQGAPILGPSASMGGKRRRTRRHRRHSRKH